MRSERVRDLCPRFSFDPPAVAALLLSHRRPTDSVARLPAGEYKFAHQYLVAAACGTCCRILNRFHDSEGHPEVAGDTGLVLRRAIAYSDSDMINSVAARLPNDPNGVEDRECVHRHKESYHFRQRALLMARICHAVFVIVGDSALE